MAEHNTQIVGKAGWQARVAVVIRTRDRPILLKRALASILCQTFEDWHLFCVNDGGKVGTIEALFAELGQADRVTLIHHAKSRGMESASNTALALAEGKFVAIHDDDDVWDPTFLEKTVSFLMQPVNECLVGVVTSYEVVQECIAKDDVVELSREQSTVLGSRIAYHSLLSHNLFPPISILLRKSVVDHVGGFNEGMPVLGDWDFNIKLMQVGDIGVIEEVLASYHQRAPSSEPSVYSNTVVAHVALHEDIAIKYRNDLMRRLLSGRPEHAALIQYMSGRIERLEHMISKPIELPDYVINKIATEVWFERQRWSSFFKLRKSLIRLVRGLSNKIRRPPLARLSEPADLK